MMLVMGLTAIGTCGGAPDRCFSSTDGVCETEAASERGSAGIRRISWTHNAAPIAHGAALLLTPLIIETGDVCPVIIQLCYSRC